NGDNSPFPGIYRPRQSLAVFQLQNPRGTWKLKIADRVAGNTGRLHSFALHFSQRGDVRSRYEAANLIEGWYGRVNLSRQFNQIYVPPGWFPPQAPPEAEELYQKVVSQSCRLCHAQLRADIDFSSYSQFINLADKHRRLVYEEGRMPLS